MKWQTALALGLVLTLPGVGMRANDLTGSYGNGSEPSTARSMPADMSDPLREGSSAAADADTNAALESNETDSSVSPDGNKTDNSTTSEGAPAEGTPQNNGTGTATEAAPAATGTEQVEVTERQPLITAGEIHSPLQGFVSHQAHEVGEISQQIDAFRAANRPDAVMAMYHMIRDHVLVKDAAQNVLARRGQPSRPVTIIPAEPMPTTPEEIIRHDIAMHEQALVDTQQLLANANAASEKAIYQHALDATQKHLDWLRTLDQGQRLSLGHFGPTMPLSMIAGYRSEIGARPASRARTYHSRNRRQAMRRGR